MSSKRLNCFYHPSREATNKCDNCGNLICLDCKMAFNVTQHKGAGDSSYGYSERHEFCQLCYYNAKLKQFDFLHKFTKKRPKFCTLLIIGIIAIIMNIAMLGPVFFFTNSPSSFFSATNFPTLIIAIVFNSFIIVLMILGNKFWNNFFKKAPIEEARLLDQKEKFLNEIDISKEDILNNTIKNESDLIYCQQCNKRIDPNAKICSHCGSSTS
ncbi:MAG: hypothetical protein GY870_14465 [archaeon]|nr:hypothetical protein [archaeon]